MAPGLQLFSDIADDGTPRLNAASGEELVRVDRAVAVALGPRSPESPGTLFVTTRRVIWLSEAEKGKGYAVDFLDITLHAVSRDLEAYPSPCIYTQIEAEVGTDEEAGESNPEAHELELSRVSEMWLILADPGQLDALFDVFCHCAELNPDPNAGESNPEANELELSRVSEMRLILADPGQLDALFDVFCHCAELNPDPNAERNGENGWFHAEDMSDGVWVHDDEDMVDENGPQFFNANPIGQNGGCDLSRSVFELQINDQRFEDAEEEQESDENGH